MSTELKSQTGYVTPPSFAMRLLPVLTRVVGPPSTDAYRRTVGFKRHGRGWMVFGVRRTPLILADTPEASFGHTIWIGASTAVGRGATFSTRMRGSPPTR